MRTSIKYPIIQTVKTDLLNQFKPLISNIILFGSYARGDFSDQSDIDILLLVRTQNNKELEDKIIDYEVDYNLKYGKVLQILIYDVEYFRRMNSISNLFVNVSNEGISLYGRKLKKSDKLSHSTVR